MTKQLTTSQVWNEIEKNLFATLGFVNSKNEARTAGVVYTVQNYKLYVSTKKDAWKTKHIEKNPNVSITIPIAKRIPFLPWIKIPAATITFSGKAVVISPANADPVVRKALYRGMENEDEIMQTTAIIQIVPEKDFITYGIGVPLMEMREPEKARGRVAVGLVR